MEINGEEKKRYCSICKFDHYSTDEGHAITCAPRKSLRLAKYAQFLIEQKYGRDLSCDFLLDSQHLVTPFGGHDQRPVCVSCCKALVVNTTFGRCFVGSEPVSYRLCHNCQFEEPLLSDVFVTAGFMRRLTLFLCLRVAFPHFYRIKDMRRYLCGLLWQNHPVNGSQARPQTRSAF